MPKSPSLPPLPRVEDLFALARLYLAVRATVTPLASPSITLSNEQVAAYVEAMQRLAIEPLPDVLAGYVAGATFTALHDQLAAVVNEIDQYMPLPLSAAAEVAALYHDVKYLSANVDKPITFSVSAELFQRWEQHLELWRRNGEEPPVVLRVDQVVTGTYFIQAVNLVSTRAMEALGAGRNKYVARKCIPRHVAAMEQRQRRAEVKMRTIYRGGRRKR